MTLYFTFIVWSKYIWIGYSKSTLHWFELLHPVIAVVLLSISLASFIEVILKRRKSVFLLLLAIFLSTCCFIYETQYSKSSYIARPIIVSGEEPYLGTGYRYHFINWIWYEKDVIRSDDSSEVKVFNHFFGMKPKGYVSSSSLIYIGDRDRVDE